MKKMICKLNLARYSHHELLQLCSDQIITEEEYDEELKIRQEIPRSHRVSIYVRPWFLGEING